MDTGCHFAWQNNLHFALRIVGSREWVRYRAEIIAIDTSHGMIRSRQLGLQVLLPCSVRPGEPARRAANSGWPVHARWAVSGDVWRARATGPVTSSLARSPAEIDHHAGPGSGRRSPTMISPRLDGSELARRHAAGFYCFICYSTALPAFRSCHVGLDLLIIFSSGLATALE